MDFLRDLDIGLMAIQFAVLLFSLSIHEAAHAWTADRFGDYTARGLGRVTLNPIPHIDPVGTLLFPLLQFFVNFPLIGWAKPVPTNPANLRNPRRDQIWISIAGPVSNLLAGGTAFLLLAGLKLSWPEARGMIEYTILNGSLPHSASALAPVLGILYYGMIINLLLAIFNILPVPPLDGHWILYGVLPEGAANALARMSSFGFILLYALLFMGVLGRIFIPVRNQIISLLYFL